MACTITQADLGPIAVDLDPAVAAIYIVMATEILLGPDGACQVVTAGKWLGCCIDPCRAVTLLAQHLIATDPSSGAGDVDTVSERVGEVSASYANLSSAGGLWAGSIYGRAFASMLGRYETCQARRQTFPVAVGGGRCR